MELEADEQHLGHHQTDGLEGLRGKHKREAQPAHIDLAIGRHGRAQRDEQHRHYEPVGGVLQTGHEQRQHRDDWRERLRALAEDCGHGCVLLEVASAGILVSLLRWPSERLIFIIGLSVCVHWENMHEVMCIVCSVL